MPNPSSAQAELTGLEGAAEAITGSPLFDAFSRAGFVARGLVYGIIGVLAVKLALGAGGKATDQQGALRTVAHQPFGHVLLVVVAAGLGGYALWRFVHAAIGHGPESRDRSMDRVAAFASGIAYAALCVIAVKTLFGGASGSSSATSHRAAGGVLGWPGGTVIVGIAGTVFIAVGIYQGYRGVTKDFLKDSKTEQMSPIVRRSVGWLGTFGHLARMVVFGLVGVFLIRAAAEYNPKVAVGLDGALAKLIHRPYGPVLLGVVAAGLIAFALYSLSDARYRRI